MVLTLRQKLSAAVLLFYWPFLFVIDHINFRPEMLKQLGASDKAVHILIFSILAFLIYSSFFSAEKISLKNYSVWLILFLIITYAAADEWLQGFVGRSRDFYDFLSNVVGILTAFVLLAAFAYNRALIIFLALSIFLMTCAVQMKFFGWLIYMRAAFYFVAYVLLTIFWIRYFTSNISLKMRKFKWLFMALLLPLGHLAATLVLSLFLKNSFALRETAFSIIAIALAVWLTCLGNNLLKKTLPAAAPERPV
jgi:VanZ family protein